MRIAKMREVPLASIHPFINMESKFGATSMHFLARQKTVAWKDFQLKKAKMDGRHALNALTRDTYKAESFRHVSPRKE